eukprot:m.185799 g.185799  ORF g.185799 m.185799 type:complete len:99 (-) comp15582_c0_seq7:750-1046(-)
MEMARAVLCLVTKKNIFDLVSTGHFVMMPEDWPAREFQEAIILQGWATTEAPERGPLYLGKLLKAATGPCLRTSKPAKPRQGSVQGCLFVSVAHCIST